MGALEAEIFDPRSRIRARGYFLDVNAERTISEQELLENLGWVQALARRLVGGDADDLVQQVCVAALDKGRIRGVGGSGSAAPRVRAWLARATAYLANNQYRGDRRRRDRERIGARPEALPATHEIVSRNALIADIVQAVQSLGEPYRTTVLLRYLEGRSTAEIALELQVSEAVVRKRLSRGLEKLRDRLGPRGFDAWALSVLVPLYPSLIPAPTATKTLGALTMATTTTKTIAALAAAGLTAAVLIDKPTPEPAELADIAASTPVASEPAPNAEPTPARKLSPAPAVVAREPVPQSATTPAAGADPLAVAEDDPDWLANFQGLATVLDASRSLESAYYTFEGEESVTAVGEYRIAFASVASLPEDGYRVETYEDGSRRAAGTIVDGHRQGEWSEWHLNGVLVARGSYDAGQKEGEWKDWDAEGVLTSTCGFVYGSRDGLREKFEAELHKFIEFRNGDKHGSARVYYLDDMLESEERWYRDRRHGLSSHYYPNGKLKSQGEFEHGQRIGVWNYWTEDGELDEERSGLVEPPDEGADENHMVERSIITIGGSAQ